jgi:hypothetical protein
MEVTSFREHVQALGSIAAEARLLLALQNEGKLPPTFFRTHSEALSDRTAEHWAELTRRATADFLLPTQAQAIGRARELSDLLRPLTEHVDPGTVAKLAGVEKAFVEMGSVR